MLDPLRLEALQPEALLRRIAPRPSSVIADVGAGPGFLTLPLARAVPRGRVIATDLRGDYLAVLSRRATEAGLRNIEVRVVGQGHSGLLPASVDLVVLCQVDHYLVDRARYFDELRGALRTGGRIAIINYRRHRDADLIAAGVASFTVVDEWAPSPGFFLLILSPTGGPR